MRTHLHAYQAIRHDVIHESDTALHMAKRAIFSMQRGDMAVAGEATHAIEKILKGIQKKYEKQTQAMDEGSYKAAVEEFVEASLFLHFLKKQPMGEISSIRVDPDVYLAGLCDVPGELYRFAIRAASEKDRAMVRRCQEAASAIIGELIEFNLTSYLRTKFDQAKQAAHKLDLVVYELALREKEI